MKYRKLLLTFLIGIFAIGMSACGNSNSDSASATKEETTAIESNVTETTEEASESGTSTEASQQVEPLLWLQLSSLETHPELRAAFEEFLGITGETGNKEGTLYYNPETMQAEQNVTLYMATKNPEISYFLSNIGAITEFSEMAAESYTDVEPDDPAAPYATLNAYFECLPDTEEGQFNGDETVSRAQAMTLVMRATTQVNESQAPEVNADFTSKVGESIYTDFAAPMNEYSYLNTSNGLTDQTIGSTMTKGEFICLLTNYIRADYLAAIENSGFTDQYSDTSDVTISTVSDAGNISLSEAINDATKGVPSDMYETFKVAIKNGYLTEATLEDWDSALTKTDALSLFIEMSLNYINNEESAAATVQQIDTSEISITGHKNESAEINRTYEGGVGGFTEYARSQGADATDGWCWEYRHGEGAGDGPTYAVYMKEGDPLYGTVYHVGDYLPSGTQLYGTDEETDVFMREEMKRIAEEDGYEVTVDEDGSYVIHLYDHTDTETE